MKSVLNSFKIIISALAVLLTGMVYAQQPEIANYRYNDQRGVNVFEAPKSDVEFDQLRVRFGGDFALQFQGLHQSNDGVGDDLVDLQRNFTLPSANLNFDVQLAQGVRMFLRTYLSSRHHTEAYVKGGYLQMDNLDFIKEGFLSGLMEKTTIKAGMDEINYGDAHFRRSDNANTIYNPFVGNYIMDAFTTEPFMEVLVRNNGLIALLGVSNGRLNQSPLPGDNGFVLYGKLGYDNYATDEVRFRITGSFYNSSSKSTRDYLYGGDRAGARYYNVLEGVNDSSPSDFLPRFNPGFSSQTAFQINPFVKASGFEFFGIFEKTANGNSDIGGSFTQLGAEALYRFGTDERAYIGGRFNTVSGKSTDTATDSKTTRINIGGGWFMTKNVLTKLEYVKQTYTDDGWDGSKFQGAEFNGIMLEAAISF
ncbi:hypothetical protein [Reichenbachiella sp. MALMAid0571]|uniref:hypothetical protein n=1 Tax=Reichenbachiella sp. MALMAid0571 TaxID=3143939 RepID=UPI0032DFD069